jgi:DNA polymerase III delta prime subunit
MTTTGTPENIKLLTTYIDHFFADPEKSKSPSFFIVSGPQNIDKSAAIQEAIRTHIGQFFYHDVLHIRDFSGVIGKKHSLKIETSRDKEDRYITITDDQTYEDIGVREINHRLQQSPMGKYKVVIIENIERITPEAANALLKSLEEPLPGRLIIATVSHASQLLETIISRALVIRFQSLLPQAMKDFETAYQEIIQLLTRS